MALFKTRARVKELEAKVARLEAKLDEVAREAFDGALAETREVRERVYPLFSQGAEANAAMIDKVAKL